MKWTINNLLDKFEIELINQQQTLKQIMKKSGSKLLYRQFRYKTV